MPWVITRDGLKSEDDLLDELYELEEDEVRNFMCMSCGHHWIDTIPSTCPRCDGA